MANPRIGMKSVLRGLELFLIGVALGTVGYYAYNHFSPTLELLTSEKPTSQGKVLYYRDPSGAPYWSATPRKDKSGRDYLPVYESEEKLD